MTFHLTEAGYGLAFRSEPIRAEEKVLFTFDGKSVDYACVGEKFFPVTDGRAEIPLRDLPTLFSVTAHARDGRRYRCDTLARVEGEEPGAVYLAPLADCEGQLLIAIAARLEALAARLDAAEDRLTAHNEAITHKPITFGGAYETN